MLRCFIVAGLFLLIFVGLIMPAPAVQASEPSVSNVQLVPDLLSGQPVGTSIVWTITATSANPLEYRLSVTPPGRPLRLMVDFREDNTVEWTSLQEGLHVIVASVRDRVTGDVAHVRRAFVMTSRVGDSPVVTATTHPLVALYSAPPCESGTMLVAWRPLQGGPVSYSPLKACRPGRSLNFYVAGMNPDAVYGMTHLLFNGGVLVERGPRLYHVTGSLPVNLATMTVADPPDQQTSSESILLQSPGIGAPGVPLISFATNLQGQVVWYDASATSPEMPVRLLRPARGGTMLAIYPLDGVADQILREVDLVGNVVRETNTRRISDQLAALGHAPFRSFHHEARQLADGRTLVLGSVERILTDVQGPGAVNVIGDYIVVLDANWQVTWVWNSFDHLDVRRTATLDETCQQGQGGCPPLFLGEPANDWTHGNAIAYSPSDGNLLFSIRHQDWVIKIDYRDGAGDGHVIWRLGPEGDFALVPGDPDLWFSHQHDPNFLHNGDLAIYDNSNLRCAHSGVCASRGQVYRLDETMMTATLVMNADLQNYSAALGSAQPLLNGNIHFNSGFQNPPQFFSTSDEFLADGTRSYSIRVGQAMYRTFRMSNLYNAPP